MNRGFERVGGGGGAGGFSVVCSISGFGRWQPSFARFE